MNICEKCNCQFKTRAKIDGQIKNLGNRKYCLECSPFNKHNTKKLCNITHNDDEKKCSTCKQIKPLIDFYVIKTNKRFSSCMECEKNRGRDRPRELKKQAVEYKGGKCQICGYNKYQGSMDFHHIDASQKEFQISHKSITKFENIQKELDKCILVCKNCHAEIHGNVVQIPKLLE